jgi:predicted RNase H-like HicB family nuclease
MRYAVVIEKADGNYSAYVPDLPGCVATGDTVKATENEIREAIRFHIEASRRTACRSLRRPASPIMSRRERTSPSF